MAEEVKKNDELEDEVVEDEEEVEEPAEDDKPSKGGSESIKGEKQFTQSQVNRMMTREKNQGRNSVYKELGIDPKDKKMVSMFKAFVESQKSDEQKQLEKQNEEQTKINEAEQRALVAEAKAEAMTLGVKAQFVDDVVTLALAKKTEDEDLKTLIGEFKTKYPVWFGKSDEDDEKGKSKKTGQKGTGSSVKSTKKDQGGEEKGLGARLAAQRKGGSKKKSYWG